MLFLPTSEFFALIPLKPAAAILVANFFFSLAAFGSISGL